MCRWMNTRLGVRTDRETSNDAVTGDQTRAFLSAGGVGQQIDSSFELKGIGEGNEAQNIHGSVVVGGLDDFLWLARSACCWGWQQQNAPVHHALAQAGGCMYGTSRFSKPSGGLYYSK